MRKVLKIDRQTTTLGNYELDVKLVFFCITPIETKTTIKSHHFGVRVYINSSLKFDGVSARFPSKRPWSVSKKTLHGKVLDKDLWHKMACEAYTDALERFEASLKNRKATVLYFNKISGDGMVRLHDIDRDVPVYACNLKGAKTWYAETACTYLVKDTEVILDYVHPKCGAIIKENNQGIEFDQEAWDNLDQDKLAFRCDENGNATNGLF